MTRSASDKRQIDLLGLASVFSISAFVSLLVVVAARNPETRELLGVVIIGLGAGGLILFRQLRKAASSLIASESRAHYAATHDDLTRLPNKALFVDRLLCAADENTGQGATPAVLYVRLDRFHEISEGFGLAASDEVITQVAARIGAAIGPRDTLAKVGDDVFGVLCPRTDRAAAEALAREVQTALSAPCETLGGAAFVTASVGIGFHTPDQDSPLEAVRQAQMALSDVARLGGGHSGAFEPGMDRAIRLRKSLEVELRNDLADEALEIVYQPQVDAKGAIGGVEALMRWSRADRGDISPSVFVPLAESCGLSEALGLFALRTAFGDAHRWPGLTVAINVSAMQIRGGELVSALKTLLEQTGANARQFELEITEGILLNEEAGTYHALNEIRRLGFSLALDDFGTGYSSLSYLRRFPVDKIKIDQSFVAQLGKQPESSAIIKAIVEMADALDLKVIAEGVETQAQVERLKLAGCAHFQGHLFSRPVQAKIIDDLVAGRTTLAA